VAALSSSFGGAFATGGEIGVAPSLEIDTNSEEVIGVPSGGSGMGRTMSSLMSGLARLSPRSGDRDKDFATDGDIAGNTDIVGAVSNAGGATARFRPPGLSVFTSPRYSA
jgi:hypothetical protein